MLLFAVSYCKFCFRAASLFRAQLPSHRGCLGSSISDDRRGFKCLHALSSSHLAIQEDHHQFSLQSTREEVVDHHPRAISTFYQGIRGGVGWGTLCQHFEGKALPSFANLNSATGVPAGITHALCGVVGLTLHLYPPVIPKVQPCGYPMPIALLAGTFTNGSVNLPFQTLSHQQGPSLHNTLW